MIAAPARPVPDDEQQRILANVEIAERKRDAERQRQSEERVRDRAKLEALLLSIQQELRQEGLRREGLELQQQRQHQEFTTRLASLQRVVAETQEIGRARVLTQDENSRITVALVESDNLKQQSASDANALQLQVNAAREREAQRREQLALLVSQAERLNEPIAPQRPRVAADGTMFVRGVSLPKDVRIEAKRSTCRRAAPVFRGRGVAGGMACGQSRSGFNGWSAIAARSWSTDEEVNRPMSNRRSMCGRKGPSAGVSCARPWTMVLSCGSPTGRQAFGWKLDARGADGEGRPAQNRGRSHDGNDHVRAGGS